MSLIFITNDIKTAIHNGFNEYLKTITIQSGAENTNGNNEWLATVHENNKQQALMPLAPKTIATATLED